jgi:hypothetical protein
MFKKIDTYLLTHYPLIWNTKALWVSLVSLSIHLLFYLAGLLPIFSWSAFKDYNPWSPDFGTGMLSVALSLLILVLWLFHYLKNNAFKVFYPLDKIYLIKEFLLIFFLLLISTTFFWTNQWGKTHAGRFFSAKINLVEEANTINMAMNFLPTEAYHFDYSNRCNENFTSGPIENQYSDTETIEYPAEETYSDEPSSNRIYSYLYYCHTYISESYIKSQKGYWDMKTRRQKADRWLKEGHKDSIKQVIHAYLKLHKKFGLDYNLNVDKWVDGIFKKAPKFEFYSDETLSSGYDYSYPNASYIAYWNMNTIIGNVAECRVSVFNPEGILGWIYTALGLSIVLFGFRTLGIRTWFITLVGSILLSIFIPLFSVLVMQSEELVVMGFLLLLGAVFVFFAIGQIAQRSLKTFAGVVLYWAILGLQAYFFLIALFVMELDKPDYNLPYDQRELLNPTYHFIQDHMMQIGYINALVGFVLILLFYIPMVYKWKGIPEE